MNARIRDIVANLLVLTPAGKYGLLPINDETGVWMEKFTHVTEEMALRRAPFPSELSRDILQSDPLPDFTSDLAQKAASRLSSLSLKRGETLVKFGKRTYMERLYELGQLRLQPATFFAKSDHNGAIKDDELVRAMSTVLSRDEIMKLVRNPQDVPPNAPEQRVDLEVRSPTDYWLYCVSKSIEPQLFVDFQANSCVIIRDSKGFIERLRSVTQNSLPQAKMYWGPAIYLDPLLPASANVFVPSLKHFKYSYQQEHRFCWLPATPVEKLDHIDVALGSLSGIGSLVTL